MFLDFQIFVSFANCKCFMTSSHCWVAVHCSWGKLKIADFWPGTWSRFRSSMFSSITRSLVQLCKFYSVCKWIYKYLLEICCLPPKKTRDGVSKLLLLQSAGSHRWASRVTSSCHRHTPSWWSLCWVSSIFCYTI